MATTSRDYSLTTLKMGDPAVDGGMGTSLSAIANIVRNTAQITQDDGTTTDFLAEEYDDAFYSITEPGKKTFTADVYIKDIDALQTLFGGTVIPATGSTPEKWQAPDTLPVIEQSVELTHKNGAKYQIPLMKIDAKLEVNFKHDSLPLIHITGTILKPRKDGVPSITYTAASE